VKDENGDLLADSHNILSRWMNYFSQLLNVHIISDARQTEIHTAEPLVPGPSHLEVEIAIAKLKKYKSPNSNQTPAELFQAGGEILLSAIHKLINSVQSKEKLPDQWKESIIVSIHKKGDKIDSNNYRRISLLSTSYNILLNILLSRLSPYIGEIIVDHHVGFNVINQLLISFSAFIKKAYDLVRREVLYSILIEG
jgi:hypothetical protein